jgi:TnpA family transposase
MGGFGGGDVSTKRGQKAATQLSTQQGHLHSCTEYLDWRRFKDFGFDRGRLAGIILIHRYLTPRAKT